MDSSGKKNSEDSMNRPLKSSPNKSARGTTKRGRGRPKTSRTVECDETNANGNLQVSSLKHVGKFRYLSKLTQSESEAKPVTSSRGRGRGRGRGTANHVTPINVRPVESSSQVSRSGRRIKPNNRWAPDADFDPVPPKPIITRTYNRKATGKANKKTIEKDLDQKNCVDNAPDDPSIPEGEGTSQVSKVNELANSSTEDAEEINGTVEVEEVEVNSDNLNSSFLSESEQLHLLDVTAAEQQMEITISTQEPAANDLCTTEIVGDETVYEEQQSTEVVEEIVAEQQTTEILGEEIVVEEQQSTDILDSEIVDEDLLSKDIAGDVIVDQQQLVESVEEQEVQETVIEESEVNTTTTEGACLSENFDLSEKGEPVVENRLPDSEMILNNEDCFESEVMISTSDNDVDTIESERKCSKEYSETSENTQCSSEKNLETSQIAPVSSGKDSEGSETGLVSSEKDLEASEIVPLSSLKDPEVSSENVPVSSETKLSSTDSLGEQLYNSSAGTTPIEDEAFDINSVLISPKPVKVKSRWRRTSELEQVVKNGNSDLSSCNTSPIPMSPITGVTIPLRQEVKLDLSKTEKPKMDPKESAAIIEERLKSFEILAENLYLTDKKTSKEVKRMLCDCTLTKEEISRGELGCGEDCINRLLMIECGTRCQLSDRCTNKRFQRKQYAKVEVFNTEKKGIGLRSLENLEAGDFIIEYIGEVIDPREFRRRAKDYARDKNKHYYFMALKSDAIIDATQQGNISRFINHSCDPNAETQKWTVNGDLRVGFFVKKDLQAGEELTFDYQFQRYGKEAQKCFCESSNCRGWIGEDPEKEDKNREKKEKKDREKRKKSSLFRDDVDNVDLDREIDKLSASGVKNRAQTLTLSRLMVRAEDFDSRKNILSVLRSAEQACRRLFLDYHGLKLLWGWMIDASSVGDSADSIQFKIDLLSTLSSLPVPNKTMLLDSKLFTIVEKWAACTETNATSVKREKEEENQADGTPTETAIPNDEEIKKDDALTDLKIETPKEVELSNEAKSEESKSPKESVVIENKNSSTGIEVDNRLKTMSSQLLESWSTLKEVFRIPKKERIEKMKEHEREADQEYSSFTEDEPSSARYSSYDRRPNNHRDVKDKDRVKRSRESPDRENRKFARMEFNDNLTKEERRRLFALKVAQEDEELRLRRYHEDVLRKHVENCLALGLDPAVTPASFEATPFLGVASPGFPATGPPVFWDPVHSAWTPYPEDNVPTANASTLTPLSESSSTAVVKDQPPPPLLHIVIPPGYDPTVMGPLIMEFSSSGFEPSGTPLIPASLVVPLAVEDLPVPLETLLPSAPSPSLQLPRFWRQAIDDRGRTYYYHARHRIPQWEPPLPEEPTPEFSTDEDDDEDTVAVTPSTVLTEIQCAENPKEQARAKRKSLLCHEKIISPRSEFERSDDAQRYRELKERVLRQKLARIRERGLWIEEKKPKSTEKLKVKEKDRRKASDKEREKQRRRAKEKYKRSLMKGAARKKIKEKIEPPVDVKENEEEAVDGDKDDDIADREKYVMDDDLMNFGEDDDDRAGDHERNKDVSANTVRKIKDAFRMKISSVIVQILNPYRKPDCKLGRITCTDDFKHLARKLTHFVLAKELKHCRNIEDLVVNDSVKHKAKDFIKKYMTKFGPVYKRGNDDDT